MITIEQRRDRLNDLIGEGLGIPNGVYLALESNRAPSDLLRNWSWTAHLWDRPTAKHYAGIENALAPDQEAWDTAHESISGSLDLRAERHARDADAQRQREDDDAAQRTAEADQVKAELRERFLRLPGTTEQEFEAEYPALLSDHRRQQMTQANNATRADLQRLARAGF